MLIFNKKGFGIIESTVAIYIITMGLLGLVSLAAQSTQVQYINKNTLIASELAQEGIELVRNMRDDNWRNFEGDWKQDIIGGLGGVASQAFAIDYRSVNNRSSIIKPVPSIDDADARLYIYASGSDTGFYTHDSSNSTPTIFYRIIEKRDFGGGGMEVICRVKWSERGRDKEYMVSTELYNWKNP